MIMDTNTRKMVMMAKIKTLRDLFKLSLKFSLISVGHVMLSLFA